MSKAPPSGRVRIIGGEWRSRQLRFAETPGLRPTPDRVRETLFNWLRDIIPGARCLDLFAGSGALGFEALSRGALSLVMIEQDPVAVAHLRDNAKLLEARQTEIIASDALSYLRSDPQPFDVVLLDPPYQAQLLLPCITLLEERGWLSTPAWIYIEAPARGGLPPLPPNWHILRNKEAGQVGYYLVQRDATTTL